MVQGHEPIKPCKGQAKHKEGDKSVGSVAQSYGDARIPIFVLAHGEISVQEPSQGKEKEIEPAPNIEEGLIQEGALPGQERIGGKVRCHPVPQLF
jgi:hypothetical protein